MDTMLATVFHGVDDIRVEEVPRPRAGVGFALRDIAAGYALFGAQTDGVLKVAIRP